MEEALEQRAVTEVLLRQMSKPASLELVKPASLELVKPVEALLQQMKTPAPSKRLELVEGTTQMKVQAPPQELNSKSPQELILIYEHY